MDPTRNPNRAIGPDENSLRATAQQAAEHPEHPGHLHHDHHEPMPEGEEATPPGASTMAVVRWAMIALVALAAVGTVGSYFGLFAGAGLQSAKQLYHCPMHPSIIQDHPGDCPICGMSLVVVENHGKETKGEGHAAAGAAAGHEGHRHDPHDPWFCPMHPEETSPDASGRCPVCHMKLSRREAGAPTPQWVAALPEGHEGHRHNPNDPYFCPMHPEETAEDASGRCPICHMKPEKRDPQRAATAVPASASEGGTPTGLVPIELSPERVQLTGMKTAQVHRARLASEIRTVGTVAIDEEGLARIQTRFAGWIEELFVTRTGDVVRKGQVLATIYSPELYTAQQEYLSARRWLEGGAAAGMSAGMQEDARRKLELLGISAQEIAEIERTGTPVRALKIRAPVGGHVVQKTALPGLYVQPGTELFQLADLSRVWLMAEVYEYEVGRVKVGQPVKLELASYPGRVFGGKVQFIYPALNPETRTLRVRIGFRNPQLELKPGMYGDVVIASQSTEGLLVPREAVVDTGREQYVFLARPGGSFLPRLVKLGVRSEEGVEVLAGLVEGETVVTTGNFLIDSESRLRAAIEGMGQVESAHDGRSPVAAGEEGGR